MSFEGEDVDVVGIGVDEVTTFDLINDVQIGIKELGAKVLLEGDVHLIMVVHKNVVKLGEAHVQRPIVEVATLPFVDKGKGVHSQAQSTQRLTTNKHLFKPNLEKVKKLLKATFKPPKGKVIRRPHALLVGVGKEAKVCHPISLQPQIEIVSALSFILILQYFVL
jgi:hypothetical protein